MRPRLALLYITQAASVAIGPSTARLSPAAVAAPSWIRDAGERPARRRDGVQGLRRRRARN